MNNVTKKDIIKNLSHKTGMTQSDILKILNGFMDEIKKSFIKGLRVELRGFGVFYPYNYKKRLFKIPNSNKKSTTEDRMILRFKTSKSLFIPKLKSKEK